MSSSSTPTIGLMVCEMLGLDPKRVRSLHIDISTDEAVLTVVYPHVDEGSIANVIRHYRLVEKEVSDG